MSLINWFHQVAQALGFRKPAPHSSPMNNVHALPSRPATPSLSMPSANRTATLSVVRAVRVVRVSEPGMTSQSAGRMVMSGRMADVCAELERLAA